ncbi:MAG: hypothetical protein LAO09_23280, partial [Acidobacteriia bacterium]|nr:hypothetical protein [Terriglobia bacterium]
LILRRLVLAQRFRYAAVFIAIELALGMTGFFAEFKEPMFIAVLVLTLCRTVRDHRNAAT